MKTLCRNVKAIFNCFFLLSPCIRDLSSFGEYIFLVLYRFFFSPVVFRFVPTPMTAAANSGEKRLVLTDHKMT